MARPKKTSEITIPDSIYSLSPTTTIKGKPAYKDNPFILPDKFFIQVREDLSIVGGGLSIEDKEKSEVSTGVIAKIQKVDTEQFIKLYTKNVGLLFDISPTAQRALIAVFYAVQIEAKDKAHIFLTYNVAVEYYQKIGFQKIPSHSSFASGIRQLISMGFLAVHYWGDGWYWFNPNLIFNGDRIRFVTEYQLKRQNEVEQNPLLKLKE